MTYNTDTSGPFKFHTYYTPEFYPKTTFMTKQAPKVGETWYYKIPGALALSKGWISDVTDHTTEVRTTEYSTCNVRYKTSEVEWVERIINPTSTPKPYPGAVTLKNYIDHVQANP